MVKGKQGAVNTAGTASRRASSLMANSMHTAGVGSSDIIRDKEAEGGTSPVAGRVEFTPDAATSVPFKLPEEIEDGIAPYGIKIINQQVTEGKLPVPE